MLFAFFSSGEGSTGADRTLPPAAPGLPRAFEFGGLLRAIGLSNENRGFLFLQTNPESMHGATKRHLNP